MNTPMQHTGRAETYFCNVDRLFYIRLNGEEIHAQKAKPTDTDVIEAVISDKWTDVFNAMREGKRVRVSRRIYYDMLGAVPPIRQTSKSFFCGEAYSGTLHHYFEIDQDGKMYGMLKSIK